ncbi:MAG: saccharopine dehydrogenase NADP-binding domain-containing protein [Cyclobacteriaceae bacterium]|nr:saccharopine dehydrogenase NADP-binding domain-containing protein [Cyclobacteriaceae bacterium]
MDNFFIYGAYGYTGRLITDYAIRQGFQPVLGGRNAAKVKALAEVNGLEYYVLEANDKAKWDIVLEDVSLVLNCAGPFALTVKDIVPACIEHGVHYLDITGEIEVFQFIQSQHEIAKEKGIALMPGVGFDVVPTDCLAAQLSNKLPSATHLELAFQGTSGVSRGTALSMARRYHNGGTMRIDGNLVSVPLAHEVKMVHFGEKDRLCVSIPWGDVFTAYYTTGIENIKVFTGISMKTLKSLRLYRKFKAIAKTKLVQWVLQQIIRSKIDGPSAIKRATCVTHIWGKATDSATGKSVEAELITPESYYLTSLTAIESVKRVLKGKFNKGYQTPAMAFGKDFILSFDKVKLNFN